MLTSGLVVAVAPNEDEGGELEDMAPEDYWRILEWGASSSQPPSFNRRAWGFLYQKLWKQNTGGHLGNVHEQDESGSSFETGMWAGV